MAVDEALLLDAAENGVGTMRFYGWAEPTLSLGYFQRYDDRFQHAASSHCKCVRRQTGGGAILHHSNEITYSISVPPGHRLAERSQELYAKVHDAFVSVLSKSLPDGGERTIVRRLTEVSSIEKAQEPFLCFQRRSVGDVVAIAGRPPGRPNTAKSFDQSIGQEWKILGSAQRRSRSALLQHGSLHLRKSAAAPELPGYFDVTEAGFGEAAISLLRCRMQEALGVEFLLSEIPAQVEEKARELQNTKYGADAWTKRR